jgi:hypothetical protein
MIVHAAIVAGLVWVSTHTPSPVRERHAAGHLLYIPTGDFGQISLGSRNGRGRVEGVVAIVTRSRRRKEDSLSCRHSNLRLQPL